MTIYWEHRPALSRAGRIRLRTEEQLQDHTGFRSMFGYPKPTADMIRKNGNTAGLRSMPLYVDKLYLDFDNEPAATNDAILKLTDMGLAFETWHTGGRGHHLIIKMEPMQGTNLPHSLKVWAQSNIPKCDLSVYKTSSIIRLPGTTHRKTGGVMKLVSSLSGNLLKVERILPMMDVATPFSEGSAELDEDFITKLTRVMTTRIIHTGANNHVTKLAYMCHVAGYDRAKTETVIDYWKTKYCHQEMDPYKLDDMLNRLYKRSV